MSAAARRTATHRRASVSLSGKASTAWGQFLVTVFLWPLLLVRGLALLPATLLFRERGSTFAPGQGAKTNGHASQRLSQQQPGIAVAPARGVQRFRRAKGSTPAAADGSFRAHFDLALARLQAWYQQPSWLLLYNGLLYNVAATLLQLLHADHLLRALLHRLVRRFAGKHTTADGKQYPCSLINSLDPSNNAALPYDPCSQFPFTAGSLTAPPLPEDPRTAHFMALCAKLAYEEVAIVRDVVTQRWGFHWSGSAVAHTRSWSALPGHQPWPCRTGWYAFSNQQAIVLVFRGSSPLDLLDWQLDVGASMTRRPGMGGVHDGCFAALFSLPQDASQCVFDAILSAIYHKVVDHSKMIFVAGHGLGGALATTFAQALHVKRAAVSNSVAGIYTFGAPYIGDKAFVERFVAKYRSRSYRYVHAADIVPSTLVGSSYVHHPCERYITSSCLAGSRVLAAECQAGELDSLQQEDTSSALSRAFRKLTASLSSGSRGSWLASAWHACLLTMPGLADHLPCEYERALRQDLDRVAVDSDSSDVSEAKLEAKLALSSYQSLRLESMELEGDAPGGLDNHAEDEVSLSPSTPPKVAQVTPTIEVGVDWPHMSHSLPDPWAWY